MVRWILQTRCLVTHSTTFLPFADLIIVMKNGTVAESGTYNELLSGKTEFSNFLMNNAKNEGNLVFFLQFVPQTCATSLAPCTI